MGVCLKSDIPQNSPFEWENDQKTLYNNKPLVTIGFTINAH